jgi:hypothetical protein
LMALPAVARPPIIKNRLSIPLISVRLTSFASCKTDCDYDRPTEQKQ